MTEKPISENKLENTPAAIEPEQAAQPLQRHSDGLAEGNILGLEPAGDNRNRNAIAEQVAVTPALLKKIIEGAIFAAAQPLSLARLRELFDEDLAPGKDDILAALTQIAQEAAERGVELKEVASGWRFQVRDDLAPWVNRLWEEKPQKYSRALLETLALIAYRQPITRGDIEEIRGVAVSSHIVKTLLERDWVKVVGQRDVPGRPSLYATTRQFLDYFNLKSLEDLPSLADIRDLDELNPMLNLEEEGIGEQDTDAPIADDAPASDEITDATELAADAASDVDVDGEDAYEDTVLAAQESAELPTPDATSVAQDQ